MIAPPSRLWAGGAITVEGQGDGYFAFTVTVWRGWTGSFVLMASSNACGPPIPWCIEKEMLNVVA